MLREFRVLLLLLLLPATAFAQRYGRPFSLAEDPQLLLQIKVQNKSHYFRAADFRKLRQSSVTESDPQTKATHTYEGVTLEQLVPATGLLAPGERIDVEFGSHQSRSISDTDLDSQVKPLVVYVVDGKQLSGHTPYYLLIKPRGKPFEAIPDVQSIALKP